MIPTIITPTDGRPFAFSLLRRWLGGQTYCGPARWIVAGSNLLGYDLASPRDDWPMTVVDVGPGDRMTALPRNLLAALDAAGNEFGPILVCEDDDFYAPDYLAAYMKLFENVEWLELAGAPYARYYNIRTRRHRQMRNGRHASLAQTAIRGEAVGALRGICGGQARGRSTPFLDLPLWGRSADRTKALSPRLSGHHVSIKGLPGTPGYGVGHSDTFGRPDPDGAIARSWGLPPIYLELEPETAAHAPLRP